MALEFRKLFQPTLLTTSLATIYTVPAGGQLLRGGRVRLTNTSASSVTYRLHAVPSAGSATDTNACVKDRSIGPNNFEDVDLPAMQAGDFIQASAGTASVVNIQLITGTLYSA